MKLNGHIDSKPIEDQKANLALRVKSPALLKIFEYLLEIELEMKKAPPANRELLFGCRVICS